MTHKNRMGHNSVEHIPVADTAGVTDNTIEVGTLLALVTGKAVPASVFTWTTDLATTAVAFVAAFLGVATGRSRADSDEAVDLNVAVDTEGIFDVQLAAADTVLYGELLGPAKAAGNALVNGCEVKSAENQACFICIETMAAAGTVCRARLVNTAHMRVNI